MKDRNKCPKCGSEDILRIEGTAGPYGVGNNIRYGLTVLSWVKIPRYVCCSCGFTEEWIDIGDIGKLKRKYGN